MSVNPKKSMRSVKKVVIGQKSQRNNKTSNFGWFAVLGLVASVVLLTMTNSFSFPLIKAVAVDLNEQFESSVNQTCVFTGEKKNELFHGNGTFECSNPTEFYSGEWFEGKKHGVGVFKESLAGNSGIEAFISAHNPEIEVPKKVPRNGQKETDAHISTVSRHGVDYHLCTSTYSGGFVDNLSHGQGEIKVECVNSHTSKLVEVERYSGEWVRGQRQGEGISTFMESAHIHLTITLRTGETETAYVSTNVTKTFNGTFINDLYTTGELFDNRVLYYGMHWCTSIYTGSLTNQLYHGQGNLTTSCWDMYSEKIKVYEVYTGTFVHGEATGYGVMHKYYYHTYLEATAVQKQFQERDWLYEGNFKKGKFQGIGTLRNTIPTTVPGRPLIIYQTGQFKNNLAHGSIDTSFEFAVPDTAENMVVYTHTSEWNSGQMISIAGGKSQQQMQKELNAAVMVAQRKL